MPGILVVVKDSFYNQNRQKLQVVWVASEDGQGDITDGMTDVDLGTSAAQINNKIVDEVKERFVVLGKSFQPNDKVGICGSINVI